MTNYRAIVHYKFKKGQEEQGLKFLESELLKKAQELGCHGIELLQSGRDSSTIVGVGHWNSLEEARKFQALWDAKEHELMRYCQVRPHHEFYKVYSVYAEKQKKVA